MDAEDAAVDDLCELSSSECSSVMRERSHSGKVEEVEDAAACLPDIGIAVFLLTLICASTSTVAAEQWLRDEP